MSTVEQLLSTAQAADVLGVSPRKIVRLVERGILTPAAKAPGRNGAYMFDAAEIDRLKLDGIPDRRFKRWGA